MILLLGHRSLGSQVHALQQCNTLLPQQPAQFRTSLPLARDPAAHRAAELFSPPEPVFSGHCHEDAARVGGREPATPHARHRLVARPLLGEC